MTIAAHPASSSPDFCVFYDASTLIGIGAKPFGPFAVSDCWLAAENLMLAACALGLGTCCIGSAACRKSGRCCEQSASYVPP